MGTGMKDGKAFEESFIQAVYLSVDIEFISGIITHF